MKKSCALVATVALAAAGTAHAGVVDPIVLEVDLSGLSSFDGIGAPSNDLISVDLPAGYDRVIGIGWDINLETVGGSFAAEARLSFADQGVDPSLFLTPAFGVNEPLPGPTNFTSGGLIDLVGLELDFAVDSGTLAIELFEQFDDVEFEADANYLADSTIFVQVIPAPGAIALLGAAGLVGGRRRRA